MSIWTISGVVLVACGTVEDFLGLDDGGGGGGRSVHVQSSPVQGARIYFDADGDGMISDAEIAAQDAFRPEGFVSDENGDVRDIPSHLYGTPFVAYLDGAFDADTGEPLSGTLHSIPDENGDHTLASPITDYIAGEVMRQAGPLTHEQLANAIDDIVERIIEIDPDADTEAAVDAFLGMVSEPTNYDGSSGVDALARYLVETNDPTESEVEAEVAKFLGDDPTAPFTATVTESAVTIGANDEYITTIEAVSHGGSVRYDFVDADGMPADVSDYIINERGVILVAEGATPTESTTLYVMVSNTGSTDTETVSVAITVEDAPSLDELPADDEVGTVVENVAGAAGGTPLITGITPTATLTNPTWVIREAVPAGLDFLVKRLEIVDGTGGTFNLVLSSGEMLDHEAIPGGVLNLHVWAVENGVRSNALEIAITVTDANDAPVFLNAVLNPDLNYAPEIAETTAIGTEIAQVEARDVDSAVVTYAITNGNVALLDGNGDPTGEMLFSIGGDGAITLQSALDYETTPNTYTLTVTATDDDDTPLTDTATVTITVTDINDESPTVAPTAGAGTVRIMSAADNAAGTGTGYTITVTDADANNDFNVSISGDPRFDFRRQTNTNTWELFLDTDQAVADSELNNQITLTYTVTDGGVGTIAARGTVMLTVVETPVTFTSPATAAARTINLAEDTGTSPTTPHFTVQARSDDGAGTRVDIARYELLDENMAVVSEYKGFQIDATSGDITLRSSLDYEMDETITLRVRATDDNDETNTLMLTVNVDDVNEHAPAFAQSAYTATISESRTAAEGSFLEITATDADGTNDVVTYSITAGDPDDLFFIDPNSGALRVADGATLNYDTTPTATTGYTLTITATDSDADNPMLSTQDVTITLTDANDIVPVVTPPQSGAFRVRTTGTEDASGNAAASTGYSITIDDADTDNTFTFGLDASSRFEFRDQGSGVWELFLKAGVAVTEAKGETITVNYQVNDGENELPPSTATLSVVDTPVTFTSPSDVPLPEGSDVGYGVTTVRAESTHSNGMPADVTDFRFVVGGALMTNDQEFTISRKLGVITLSNVLDYDADGAQRVFNLVVRATDENGETNDQMLTIRLGDENDNAPVFAASTYTETVDETYAVGTEIARVSATDADGTDEYSNVTYSITGGNVALVDDAGNPTGEMLFTIGSDGAITLNAPLDFETAPSHTLTIGASDGADADGMDDTVIDATATVTITVGDINDESPSVPNHAETGSARITTVADNPANGDGVSMGYVVAVTDADADATNTLEVSVGGATSDRFEFRRQTGTDTWELYLKAGEVIDEAVGDEIPLSYTVTDGGAPLTVPVTNTFTLTAVDTPVRFTPPTTAALMVDENDANWQLVLVAVSDAGGGDTSPIATYEFVDGSSTDTTFGVFSITTNNDKHGVISISGAFDFETDTTTHKLTVRATDSRTPDPEIQDIEFTVTVRDLNEAPAFGQPTYTATIAENLAVGDAVTTVTAEDDDAGTNGQVRYAITGGSGMEFFEILDPTSGAITVKQALNYDTTPTATTGYMLEITATDGGALTDTAMVDITLMDVEDSDPTWTTGNAPNFAERAAVASDTETGFSITLSDDDTDAVNDHNVVVTGTHASRFKFVEDGTTANQWNLVLISGQEVDREAGYVLNDILTIEYQVMDGTRFTSSPASTVGITITDINDNKPVIPDQVFIPTYASGVPESAGAVELFANEGVNPGVLLVNDADLNQSFTYRIVSIDGVAFGDITNPLFGIQSTSGRFGLIGKLDYETAQSHSVVFEVTDQGGMVSDPKEVMITVLNADEGDATYAVSGSVAEDATLTAMLVAGREDPDGVDSSVDVMYRWFTKSSADPNPTSFTDSGSGDFQWLAPQSTTNTYTISGMPVAGQYGVLVGYKDNSVGDALSFVPVLASSLKFTESTYTGSIDEDSKNPTTIDIDATLDSSADDITYAFVTDASTGTTAATHKGFAIDATDGTITFTGTASTHLNFESITDNPIPLTVRATHDNGDPATPNPFGDVKVAITVNDLNDELPVLAPATAGRTSVNVFEASPTSFVRTGFMFTVTDADAADASFASTDFTVSGDSRFGVEAFSNMWELVLKANTVLDYETPADRSIDLEITVEDANGNISIALPVEVITVDQNDVRPGYGAFTWQAGAATGNANEEHIRTIAENINADGEVELLRIALTDSDTHYTQLRVSGGVTPSGQIFYITRDDDEAVLHMNAAAMAEFDYEDETSHTIWFTVDDDPNDNIAAIRSQDFIINVMDVNDNDPVLTVTSTATIDEQTGPMGGFDTGIDFSVTDRDAVTYSQGDFEITDRMGNVDDRFQVIFYQADQEGDIYLKEGKTLEYDDGDTIELRLAVTDDQAPAKTATKDFTITLNDVKSINLLDGKEYTATDTLYTATTEIAGTITYTLGGRDANLFDIDATSGAITFQATTTLDDDATSSYSLTITATGDTTESQSIAFDVSSVIITSADTGSNSKSFTDAEIAKTAPNVVILRTLTADTANNATVTYAITGGADMDLFSVRTVLSQGQGMVTKLELNIRGDFVRKAQYEVEITATNDDTMETDVQMYTHTISGYPETPPVIKLTLPDGQGAINYVTPLNIDDEDIDIITFTIEDPDKDYVASDISVVGSDGTTADARFTVTWDAATQTGTLQAAGTGVTYADLSVPFGGEATDPRWTSTFIRVTDTPEGSIASGDDVRVVLRVAERSVVIGSGQEAQEIRNADINASGTITAAVITQVTVEGTSAMVDWTITGGADAALFTLTDRANHGTNVRLNLDQANFVKKAEYKVKLTATNSVTEDTDDIEITITVTGFVAPAPAITPDRQQEAHAPYDPDDDPIAGIVPIPDTDPNG